MRKHDILERLECWRDKHWHTLFIVILAGNSWSLGLKMAEGDWLMVVISAVLTVGMAWCLWHFYRIERAVTESQLVAYRDLAKSYGDLDAAWRSFLKAERNINLVANVTQKDATLREIIDWCDTHHVTPVSRNDMSAIVYNQALENTASYCRKHLGYSGVMPLEVPNQSEGADQCSINS